MHAQYRLSSSMTHVPDGMELTWRDASSLMSKRMIRIEITVNGGRMLSAIVTIATIFLFVALRSMGFCVLIESRTPDECGGGYSSDGE